MEINALALAPWFVGIQNPGAVGLLKQSKDNGLLSDPFFWALVLVTYTVLVSAIIRLWAIWIDRGRPDPSSPEEKERIKREDREQLEYIRRWNKREREKRESKKRRKP